MKTAASMRGITLLELLVVLAILGLLAAAGSWGSAQVVQRWQTWRGAQQVLEDFKEAQAQAERAGSQAFNGGALEMAHSFLVFEPAARRYQLYRWQDRDGDGRPGDGESRLLWTRELPPTVRFGWVTGVDRKACSNGEGSPAAAITFGTTGYPPCAGRPCLKFDQLGFSALGPGAVYLIDGAGSFALTATRSGHFTVCRWDGQQWR